MYKIIGADQKEYGPITTEILRQWIAEGRVNANTRVQAEGTTEWKPLSQMPEFGLAMPAPLPATITPPLSSAPSTNATAMWAFGVSLFSFFCCQVLGGIIALVLGIVALSQLNKFPHQKGKGFAIAAVVIGGLSLLVGLILTVVYFSVFTGMVKNGFPR